jgi:hypothetical protein
VARGAGGGSARKSGGASRGVPSAGRDDATQSGKEGRRREDGRRREEGARLRHAQGGGRRVASLQPTACGSCWPCYRLAARLPPRGRGATRARRAHSHIQKCRAHGCCPRSCVSMRQAADAAKDKAKEEKPVDPVVAAMTGEFLRPIPRVVLARASARPAARRKCAQCRCLTSCGRGHVHTHIAPGCSEMRTTIGILGL